jgi:hypothetical protein
MKKGDTVNIYLNSNYNSKYEGSATLIKRIEKGHSFIIPEEKLFTKLEDKALNSDGSHFALSKLQKLNNIKWNKLNEIFSKKELKPIEKKLVANLNRDINNYDTLNDLLFKLRLSYLNDSSIIRAMFMDFNNDELIRFIQQKHFKHWTYTIYRNEKWLVEFIPEQYDTQSKWCLFSKPFRTTRKIRSIVCICPDENTQSCEMMYHTTDESGKSNGDRAEIKQKLKDNELDKSKE